MIRNKSAISARLAFWGAREIDCRIYFQIFIAVCEFPCIQETEADNVCHFLPVDFAELVGWLVVVGVHGSHKIENGDANFGKRCVVAAA